MVPHSTGNLFVQQSFQFFPCLLIELHNRFSCFCQVCTAIRHNQADKRQKAFEESFDDIWLSPAVSHSPLCRRGTEGMHNQLSGLYKLFTFLKVKDYTRFTAGENSTHPSSSSLISILLPKAEARLDGTLTERKGYTFRLFTFY